jgi:aryl-alcohol dehydrogenase-like predicted oxidoreductase
MGKAMERRAFGKTGMQVSAVGFGAAEIGFEHTDDSTVDALLGVALDVGINVIDTAAMYCDSEEKIGRVLRGKRKEFLLFTKCGRPSGTRRAEFERRKGDEWETLDWHPASLEQNIEQSLRRLQTDRIDLIQLHSCSQTILLRGEVQEVLHCARQAGKVLHIGYSGDGPAAEQAIQSGSFEAVQVSINVADQEALDSTVPLARQLGTGVIAKRPVANGLWRTTSRPERNRFHAYWERLKELRYDFLQGESAFSTALRFTLTVAGVHTAIVGTTNPYHLRKNAEYWAQGPLHDGQFDEIRAQWKRIARSDWVAQL